MNSLIFGIILTMALAAPTAAETPQPYAGLQTRPIKALSEQQIADLKAGRGMGLALAAELNGYPGPIHVLELADALGISDAQRARMKELFEAMRAETVPLGERLIAEEAALERQFADRRVTEASLVAAVRAIGATQAALRAAHLKYHLATAAELSTAQIEQYAKLRGYKGGPSPAHQHRGRH